VIIGIFQDGDGHVLGFPAPGKRIDRLIQLQPPNVVVYQDEIRIEADKPFKNAFKIKGNLGNDTPPMYLV
jgi:hypothetical protein